MISTTPFILFQALLLLCLSLATSCLLLSGLNQQRGLSAIRERVYREMCVEYGFKEEALRAHAKTMKETLYEIQRRYKCPPQKK